MKKTLIFIVLSLFLVSMMGFVLAVPAPCSDDELAEDSNYGIVGTVKSVSCNETFEDQPCVNGSINILQKCTAKVEITEVLKGSYEVGDEIEIEFDKMYELNDTDCIPGSFTETFTEGHKIKYYDASSSCIWSRLIDLGVADEENETDDDNGVPNITRIHKIRELKNRLQIYLNATECPNNCTCTGSTIKCWLNGQREMTVVAGRSGNIIVQVKGINASTNVTLYKSEGKLYGVFEGNETKRIMTPEQVQEKIRERKQARWEEHNITLDEDGYYRVQSKKKARLFFLIPVREKVRTQIDAETGEIIKIRNPWWGFLARDIRGPVLGGSCATVNPDNIDECCQNKGYDIWDSEEGECVFSE